MTNLEHVTDSRTRDRCHLTATHPGTEPQLDVFASPDFEALIKRTNTEEILLVHGDGASHQSRREERQTGAEGLQLIMIFDFDPRISEDIHSRFTIDSSTYYSIK